MSFIKDVLTAAFERGLRKEVYERAERRAFAALDDYIHLGGLDETEENALAGMAFVAGHSLGEIDALRRAKLALSDPRARGVEREALGHLAEGWSIEDALRKARASPPSAEKAGNVIQLPRRR